MTLLEKAKKSKSGSRIKVTPEKIALAIAWARDEVTITQCTKAIGIKHGAGTYSLLAIALKAAVINGKLRVA